MNPHVALGRDAGVVINCGGKGYFFPHLFEVVDVGNCPNHLYFICFFFFFSFTVMCPTSRTKSLTVCIFISD